MPQEKVTCPTCGQSVSTYPGAMLEEVERYASHNNGNARCEKSGEPVNTPFPVASPARTNEDPS